MLHVIRQIESRFPSTAGLILPIAVAVSACALAVGVWLAS